MKLQRKTGVRKGAARRSLKKSGRAKMAAARASASGVALAPAGNAEVRRLSRTYHLSNEAVSRVTGASPRTVAYWNAGTPPQRSSVQKIREVIAKEIVEDLQPWIEQEKKEHIQRAVAMGKRGFRRIETLWDANEPADQGWHRTPICPIGHLGPGLDSLLPRNSDASQSGFIVPLTPL